ncbi:MAG: ATP-binding protein [Pseudomonadota bacterium]
MATKPSVDDTSESAKADGAVGTPIRRADDQFDRPTQLNDGPSKPRRNQQPRTVSHQRRDRPQLGRHGNRRIIPSWVFSDVAAAAALTAAGVFAFVTTWLLLSPQVESVHRQILIAMIVANVLIAAGFMGLIGTRLWHVWSDRRNQLAGSRTHIQLVGIFAAIAAAPAIMAFLFSFMILRTSLNDVFSSRIDAYHDVARDMANTFVENEAAVLNKQMAEVAYDINKNETAGLGLEKGPISFRRYLTLEQALFRGFAAMYVFDGDRRLIVRIETIPGRYNIPEKAVFDDLDRSAAPGERYRFGANDGDALDFFRGAIKLANYGGGYLVVYKPIAGTTQDRLLAVKSMRGDWEEAKEGRARLERVFFASFILLAIIILFGAIWLALWAATRLVRPVGRLVRMAERVSSGDLGARVDAHKSDGDLGALASAMNRMTAQLQTQRNDLIETNREVDTRRRFSEAVLAGVSAGVIGVSTNGRVVVANSSAAELIDVRAAQLTGAKIERVFPEIAGLLADAAFSDGAVAGQVEIERDGALKTLNVRIASDDTDGDRSFVVTFDDITQLVAAQRSAAWGDVARRIAHEIKNPLTPIQLSAERLRRKYADEVTSSPEVFERCTETIIRHVSDIGRMVDEFSSFARMPKPVIASENVFELVKTAVFPQRVAFPDIEFVTTPPAQELSSKCDGRLIVQALSNVLKNAGESIGARIATQADSEPGRILVQVSKTGDKARIDVFDNGVGLPESERHRLTEPYMTTRAKGTGLGLAIVKKVIEEHGGMFTFGDDQRLGKTGARMTITLPAEAADVAAPAAAE